MATTDKMKDAQKELASFAYDLKVKYRQTMGLSRGQFIKMYMANEIQLSSVYENLFVSARKRIKKPIERISEDNRDFSNNGDFKITTLLNNGPTQRRFVISGVANKIGTIYCVGWNWVTNKPNFFAIPRPKEGFPKQGIKIPICSKTGGRSGGKYNLHAYDTFEKMAFID